MVRRPALRGVGGGRGGRPVKVAVVDLGTNTCRLLFGEAEGGAVVRRDARETHVVRLGQGVDQSGRLDGGAAARTRRRLADYAARIDAYAPERRLLVATSVLRDAADGAAFLAAVEGDLGLPYRVIGGEEEALLAFRGATAGLGRAVVERQRGSSLSAGARTEWHASQGPSTEGRGGPDGPLPTAGAVGARDVVVVDIGGGSTEFAVGRPGESPRFVRSLDIGAVRLTERFFAADPPTEAQWRDAVAFVDDLLGVALPADLRAATDVLIGVAGTFTTLIAHELGMRVYDPARVHGRTLTVAQIDAAVRLFRALTSADRRRLPGIQKGREDVILAGALIARAACRAFGAPAALVSEDDILEGIALWLADGLPPLT